MQKLPQAATERPTECAWCGGPLPPAPHARESQDGSTFCSGTCERKYEVAALGIDEGYG